MTGSFLPSGWPFQTGRHHSNNERLKRRHGVRVHKVTLDAGFTCPNRDGTKGYGGCTFCNNEGFSPNTRVPEKPIRKQMEDGMRFMRRRFKAEKFIAYFQAFTNTYAPVEHLKSVYDQVLDLPDVVGISVGTRPDCVPEETLDLLETYAGRFAVQIELGLQSMHDRTLERVNRGHGFAEFADACERIARRGAFDLCAHIIHGLPGETRDDMLATVSAVSESPIDSIKIHLFHVMRGTADEKEWKAGRLTLFEPDDYIALVCDSLEILRPEIAVERLTADAPPDILLAPLWCLDRNLVAKRVKKELERRGTWQGCKSGFASLSAQAPAAAFHSSNAGL